MQMDDPVHLWLPLQIEPNRDCLFKAVSDLPDSVTVKGLVSSELRDLEGERIVQSGIDWSWFLKYGHLTFGHPATEFNKIGRPLRVANAKLEDGTPATWLEGNLWLRKPLGQQAYLDHQAALAAGDAGMGFSIEGNALERDPNDPTIVLRCIVYTVAIAFQPINPITQLDPIEAAVAGLRKALTVGAGSDGTQPDQVAAWLIQTLTGLLGMGPQGSGSLAALAKATTPDPTRLSLLKGVSNDDLRALRIARQDPDITFAEAASTVAALTARGNDR